MSNKQRQKQKKRQKRAMKRAMKQKASRPERMRRRNDAAMVRGRRLAKRLKMVGDTKKLLDDGVNVPEISEDDHIFWLCHGANYIISDGEEGVWDPLFEGIYEGKLPAAEDVANVVLSKFSAEIESEEGLVGVPRSVLAWTVSDESAIRIYKYEAEQRIRAKDPDGDAEALARQPHNAVVWDLMNEVKKRTMAA